MSLQQGSLRHLIQLFIFVYLEIFLVIKRMVTIRLIRYSQQKPLPPFPPSMCYTPPLFVSGLGSFLFCPFLFPPSFIHRDDLVSIGKINCEGCLCHSKKIYDTVLFWNTTAFLSGAEKCRTKTFRIISRNWGFCNYFSSPPLAFISSFHSVHMCHYVE